MSWVAIIIIVLIVLLLIVGVLQFNRLRRLNVQVDGAFAGIDTLLTKRADLIPNLVETVKGAAGFEQSSPFYFSQRKAAGFYGCLTR